MTLIGLLLGYLGRRFNLAQTATITRVMVIVVTIRLMILGSEGEIATQYVLWIRSMAAIGVLHWALARLPVPMRYANRGAGSGDLVNMDRREVPVFFPNLLR
jgi:hypothetical protein